MLILTESGTELFSAHSRYFINTGITHKQRDLKTRF